MNIRPTRELCAELQSICAGQFARFETPPIWVKTYGRPEDPFLRIRDSFTLHSCGEPHCSGGHLRWERAVVPRGYAKHIECTFAFKNPGLGS